MPNAQRSERSVKSDNKYCLWETIIIIIIIIIVQTDPVAHAASYTIGTGSFSGEKLPGRGVDHPPHLASRLKKE